jgi:alanyl-tRNA synthetase
LNVFEDERNKFEKSLEKGLKELDKLTEINAKDAFFIYQTFGFPIEMIQELAIEKNISIDLLEFQKEEEKHKELSRIGAEQKFKGGLAEHTEITEKYHTVTHILNEALRKIISKDIKQKGSNITAERLRFDFNFDRKLTDEEILAVEKEVNDVISQNLLVTKESMKLEDAINFGAQAEFGNRYPEVVFVYSVGNYSKEICMGPH